MADHSTPYQQVVDAIEDTLFAPDSSGKNRFERELDNHVGKRLGRWLLGGGFLVIIVGSGLYFTLENRVSAVEETQKRSNERLVVSLTEIKNEISSLRNLLIEVIRTQNE